MDDVDWAAHYRGLVNMYAGAPINQVVRSTLVVREGEAEVTIEAASELFHAGGGLHGSVYFKALDDAGFFAANSVVSDSFVLTAKYEVELLGMVTGGRVRATGRLDRRDGRKLWASSELVDAEGKLVARGSGLFVASAHRLDGIAAYRDG